jgi:hypothetical protein
MPQLQMEIPKWLYQSIRQKFMEYPNLLKKEDISFIKLNHFHPWLQRDVLAAFVNIEMKDGIFVLYETTQDGFRQIYEKRLPVIGVQAYWDNNLMFTARVGSGTGYWIDEHYLIRHTNQEYKEVWKGLHNM